MKMTQVYDLLNTITTEELGDSIVVNEDLSNVVDIGRAFENLDHGVENFVRRLHDHIGKMVFVDRVYQGRAPSVLMDGWEFGSILEKVRMDLPEAEANETWELVDRATYDPNVFYQPKISVKFYNNRVTFMVPISITERQVKSAFSNATQLNAFVSMIYTWVENCMTMKIDSLIMRTINAGIGETMYDYNNAGTYTGTGNNRAVNLLALYNQTVTTPIQASDALHDPAFLRFATKTMKDTLTRMQDMSKLFNIGGTVKFTPEDRQHVVMLSEFRHATEVYLYDGQNQFNTENLRLPTAEVVNYWQAPGTGYSFDDTGKVKITTPTGHTVTVTGVLAVAFDRDALGVANIDRRVNDNYNPVGEFWSKWHKFDAGYFLDLDENFVVFYVA